MPNREERMVAVNTHQLLKALSRVLFLLLTKFENQQVSDWSLLNSRAVCVVKWELQTLIQRSRDTLIVRIDFGMHQEFINISENLGERIKQLQTEFLGWLYSKEIDHNYWMYKDGEKWGVNYNGSAFVEWLNHNVSEKIILLEGDQYISTITIYF